MRKKEIIMNSFLVDHWEFLFRLGTFVSILIGFGILIFRQGRHFGKNEIRLKRVEDKVAKNCTAVQSCSDRIRATKEISDKRIAKLQDRLEQELHEIEKSRFVKHTERSNICRDCKGDFKGMLEATKNEIDKDLANNQTSLKEISTTISEMEKNRQLSRDKDSVKIDSLKESMNELALQLKEVVTLLSS